MFARVSALKLHLNTVHEISKGHVCNICKKSFNVAQSLKVHIKTMHAGVKHHECSVCSKSFNRAST